MTAAFPPIYPRPDPVTVRNLLRSLAVAPAWQGQGLGSALVAHAEQAARQRGIAALYLLTPTAEAFFARRGYVRLPREAAPSVLRQTTEFASLCPASAVCLTRTLTAAVDRATRN
jgi:amino-acid N-acetyltransferase